MKQFQFTKLLALLSLLFITHIVYCQKGMPFDDATGKVTYSGTATASDMTKAAIADKLAQFLNTYTSMRGSVNSVYVSDDKSGIYSTLSISATANLKTVIWFVNAALTIDISDNSFQYKLTDLYIYGITSSFASSNNADGIAIEGSNAVDVRDFEKKNHHAENAHNIIVRFLDDLSASVKSVN